LFETSIAEVELTRFINDTRGASVIELDPRKSIRTFRNEDQVFRIDMATIGEGLRCEAMALDVLQTAAVRAISPPLIEQGHYTSRGNQHLFLRYPWISGRVLKEADLPTQLKSIGSTLSDLHSARVFDLRSRFPRQYPITLMNSFKTTSDQLKSWMLMRESEGLEPDLLTLTLSDIQRALRQFAIAQDHFFRTAQRRVLCHGAPRPTVFVLPHAADAPLWIVGFEDAYLGDAAEDLASFSIAASLSDEEEEVLLESYLDRLEETERPDEKFVPRFFARRFLGFLNRPINLVQEITKIKNGDQRTLEDPIVAIEERCERVYEELVRTLNGLRPFMGSARPISAREVKAMGRVTTYEEMLLHGRTFRITLTGLPFAGKTLIATALARRLKHPYVNTNALLRIVAHLKNQSSNHHDFSTISKVFEYLEKQDLEFRLLEEAPFYEVFLNGVNVSATIKDPAVKSAVEQWSSDANIPKYLGRMITRLRWAPSCVIEGPHVQDLLTGHVHSFYLTCDTEVRCLRLRNSSPHMIEADEANDLLADLDKATVSPSENATVIDGKSSAAPTSVLRILWHLLPPGRRPNLDSHSLSGRNLLFTR
jgi:cytidylate kinase